MSAEVHTFTRLDYQSLFSNMNPHLSSWGEMETALKKVVEI